LQPCRAEGPFTVFPPTDDALAVDTSNGVVINGTANVTATDIMASNGVMHVIDAVILPPGVDAAALIG